MIGEPLDCNVFVELVTDYLDEAMDLETRARFEAHLAECDGCTNYLEQFRVTVRMLSGVRADDLDPVFRSRLLDALSDWNSQS